MNNILKDFFSYPKFLVKACFSILSSPKLIFYASIPYLIAFAIFIASIYIGMDNIHRVIKLLNDTATGVLYYIFGSLAFFIILILTSILSFVGMSTIGGFFIDLMIEQILINDNFLPKEGVKLRVFLKLTCRSIFADILIAFIVAFTFTTSVALSFIPPLSFLPLLLGAFMLAFGMFNRVMSILLITFKKRLKFILSNKLTILTYGIFLTLIFLLPFANIILMPPCLVMTCRVYENLAKKNLSNNTNYDYKSEAN